MQRPRGKTQPGVDTLLQDRRDELEGAAAAFEATSEIAHALAAGTDLAQVLELIATRARALTEARALIVLIEDQGELVVAALAGPLEGAVVGERIRIEGSIRQVLRSGKPMRLAGGPGRLPFAIAGRTQARTGVFVPLRLRGKALGVLSGFDRLREGPQFSVRDEQLLSAFAVTAAAAVVTAQDAKAESLHRTITAAEQERMRWARDLHDGTLQELAALKMLLEAVRVAKDDHQRDKQLRQAADWIDIAIGDLRNLITDLRPPVLDEYGIRPALEALAERSTRPAGSPSISLSRSVSTPSTSSAALRLNSKTPSTESPRRRSRTSSNMLAPHTQTCACARTERPWSSWFATTAAASPSTAQRTGSGSWDARTGCTGGRHDHDRKHSRERHTCARRPSPCARPVPADAVPASASLRQRRGIAHAGR